MKAVKLAAPRRRTLCSAQIAHCHVPSRRHERGAAVKEMKVLFANERSLNPTARLLVAVVPVVLVTILGSLVTRPNIPGWYAGLEKPIGTPPNWVFGPTWMTLYALMAFAFWRILRLPRHTDRKDLAVVAFIGQLALNLGWSIAFFGFQSPVAGLVVIGVLLGLVAACVLMFWRLDKASGWCLVPYALWVGYATYLNAGVWALNG
jgi:translocator protein